MSKFAYMIASVCFFIPNLIVKINREGKERKASALLAKAQQRVIDRNNNWDETFRLIKESAKLHLSEATCQVLRELLQSEGNHYSTERREWLRCCRWQLGLISREELSRMYLG